MLGEGAKWRRLFGQQIYSPLLLAFSEQVWKLATFTFNFRVLNIPLILRSSSPMQDEDNWLNSNVPTFTGIDPSYSLPENVAVITLQVACTSCPCAAVM